MHEVYFYQDKNGKQPVKEYLDKLEKKSLKSKEYDGGFQSKGQWI